jgi:MFS family permease
VTTGLVEDQVRPPRGLRARWAVRVGGLPRPYWYLWAGMLANRLGSVVGPFLALYLSTARDFSVAEVGVVLTALGFGSACSQSVGGVLADRIGRRRTMVLGLLSSAVALGLVGLSRGLLLTCLAAAVYGLVLDLYRPAMNAAVADIVPAHDRVRAFGLTFWAINLGFGVAAVLAGYLAERGFWLLFVLDAVTCVVFAGLVLRGVPESRPERTGDPGRLRDALSDRLLLGLVVLVVLHAVVYMQSYSTLPLVIREDGLGPSGYGLAMALNGFLIVLVQPWVLQPVSRLPRGRVLLVAALVQAVGFGGHAFADTTAQHAMAVAVWTLGEVLGAGLFGALVAGLAPAHLRGRYMGVFGTSFGLAALLAPALGTATLAGPGEGTLWAGAAVLMALSGVGLRLLDGRVTERERATGLLPG